MAEHLQNLKKAFQNLFKSNDLPMAMHAGTPKNTGVALSSVNKYVASSLAWLLFSFILIVYGWRHCGYYSQVSNLDCVDGACTLSLRLTPNDDNTIHTFLAQDFIESSTVRINEVGEIASTNGLSRKEQGKLGHSVQLKFKNAPEVGSRFKVQQTTLFSSTNLGKRPARTMNNKINEFIGGKDKQDSFNISAGSRVTVTGVLCIAFGVISVACALLFGHWSDPTPRRLRKVQ